jgi:hypothetical protein
MAQPKLVVPPGFYFGLGNVQLDQVSLRAFAIPADQAKLQAWLDETFATPSGGKVAYDVIGSQVFLSIAEIGKQRMLDPADANKGWTTEVDAFLSVAARRENNGLFAYRLIPIYLFVDTGIALAAGRELWGFPKQLGRFTFDPAAAPSLSAARKFTAQTFVTSPFNPNTQTRWAPVIELQPKAAAPGGGPFATVADFVAQVLVELGGDFATLALQIASLFGVDGLTMAMLRQLPDASNPTYAAYQAILEADSIITNTRGMGFTDDSYQVRITSYDSHPFLTELGIAGGWQDVGRGAWVDYDFTQDLATEVWRAP